MKDFARFLPGVKAAGFHGICFDIEMTIGEIELVKAVEQAFAACKRADLLVMVTTSHSAPYAAASEASKIAFVDSWIKSPHLDIFSPQLYSRGRESQPEFETTPCLSNGQVSGSHCSYERLKGMKKAIWMPSLATSGHYQAAKDFFAGEGIQIKGFIQWNRGHGDHDPKASGEVDLRQEHPEHRQERRQEHRLNDELDEFKKAEKRPTERPLDPRLIQLTRQSLKRLEQHEKPEQPPEERPDKERPKERLDQFAKAEDRPIASPWEMRS
jgi:hypothetical protein